ncbi:MAG: type II secretion system protein [Eubacterium sp.]|nr:type II secretion system protein [Eubacterium sp.]
MKKQFLNNRGFSLVELLIAVAVMAILITPIVSQLVQTVNTSGQAKEKQYVVDNVENVVEQFRTVDTNNGLDDIGDVISNPYLGTIELVYDSAKDTTLPIDPIDNKRKIPCKLVDSANHAIDCYRTVDHSEKKVINSEVFYSERVYSVNSSDDSLGYYLLGKKKTKYTATIVESDLNNVIAECYVKSGTNKAGSLEVDFDLNTNVPSGFDRRSDNMIIKSTNTEIDDNISVNVRPSGTKKVEIEKINAVVCRKNSSYADVIDPNSQEVANLQNIDSKTMAIITSDATTFDYEIEKDIARTLVHYAQANPDTTLGKKANDPEELNKYIKDLILNPYSIQKSRAIYLSITAPSIGVSGKPDYYNVRCDVIYRVSFTGTGSNLITPFGDNYSSSVGTYSYNVLNRDYYTKDPTNVYMVYEPLLLTTKSGLGNRTYYADNDYIYITTDQYTNNVLGSDDKPSGKSTKGYKSPTIYLIGSNENWAKATGTQTNTYLYEGYDYHMYRTYFGNDPKDVNIVLCNTLKDPNSTATTVYTNIAVATYADGSFPEPNKRRNRLKQQFKVDGTFADIPTISDTLAPVYDNSPSTTKVGDEYSYVKPYYSEKTTNVGRLFQITAVFKNQDTKEKTYISGAKGAN